MSGAAFASWQFWAILSAVFAALTAIFAKVGVAGINADLATLIRTLIILSLVAGIVAATGQWQPPSTISTRSWTFLVLSGLGNGRVVAVLFPCAQDRRGGESRANRQIERGARGGDRGRLSRRETVIAKLDRHRLDRCGRGACRGEVESSSPLWRRKLRHSIRGETPHPRAGSAKRRPHCGMASSMPASRNACQAMA